jgi:membrane protease YdiL (CAAX protease family)
MHTLFSRVRTILWAGLLAVLVAGSASVVWGALLVTNLLTSPTIPWSVAVMAVVLLVMWRYLGGRWWPRSSSQWRRRHLRATLVQRKAFGWAWLAGAFALAALVGLWIVLVELTGVGGNPTIPGASVASPLTLALGLVMGALVSSITEEMAFRGYAQVTLEREFWGGAAVALSSLFFALWHGPTQGFEWSKLLFYFLVGVAFGTTAYLTKSILPALPVHLAGDLIFFFLIWPNDAARRFVWRDGTDVWFWLYVAMAVLFSALAIVALRRLAQAMQPGGPPTAPAPQVASV